METVDIIDDNSTSNGTKEKEVEITESHSALSLDDNAVDTIDGATSFEHVNTEVIDVEDKSVSGQNSSDPFALESSSNPSEDATSLVAVTTVSVVKPSTKKSLVDASIDVIIPESQKNSYFCVVQSVEDRHVCRICKVNKIVKYCCTFQDEKTFICQDACLYQLQKSTNKVYVHEYFTKFYCPVQIDSGFKFIRQCAQCAVHLKSMVGTVSWEAMDFCKEPCLFRYQKYNNKYCAECKKPVAYNQLGKYGVRFGCIMRQFCSSQCLETKKKKIRICSFCQKSIRRTKTKIGSKFFCHDICKGMYEHLQKPNRPPFLLNPDDARCYVCKQTSKPLQIEFDYHRSSIYLCSMKCFTIFKFVQNCSPAPKKCHTCSKYCLQQYLEKNALFYDGHIHHFCSPTCQHIYIITHRRVVPCIWCKVKKYNFDMIQKNNFMDSTVYTCSLFCLNQLKVSIDAVIAKKKTCFNCPSEIAKYDLKLTDGSTQTFCSNKCITTYQMQFTAAVTVATPEPPTPYKRTRRSKQVLPDKPGPLPVITNVCSLAPTAAKKGAEVKIRKILIVKYAERPEQKNIATLTKPEQYDKSTFTEDVTEVMSVAIQTDIKENGIKIIPILIPIYVPFPLPVWRAPWIKPMPFPLFIPCPILIPITRNTAAGLLKDIKKDQPVKAPADPFEAELLMMAELVAAEKKEEEEVPSEDDNIVETAEEPYSPEPVDTTQAFGDDMLQMALKLATDFEEGPVDLEGALTANTITPSQPQNIEVTVIADIVEDPPALHQVSIIERGNGRGRRRGSGRNTRQNPIRRARRSVLQEAVPTPEPEPAQPVEPVEKPDAHMCLKYTFGVNAWKQWVQVKNVELERSSRRLKLFNTDLLQLTSDELNYSLCLFVQEVRKPNGSDYAPDTIYYLCLGIQQFLYENGRIDNIFCDAYYDKFTDCLDVVCRKFAALYNDSHYIVTRVEEEHLWESKQLGAHSPHVLLTTLMFFNTKHFNLTIVDEHMQLSFSHIMKHWKRNPTQPGVVVTKQTGSRNVLLRFYPPQTTLDSNSRKKKVYEQQENEENPLRCPVKLYEFYLSKCPESVKTRNDVFYLLPERSCVPDSPVWYSTMALDRNSLDKMLYRVKMVKEINVALLTN